VNKIIERAPELVTMIAAVVMAYSTMSTQIAIINVRLDTLDVVLQEVRVDLKALFDHATRPKGNSN
jgi:hypothetical protein